MAKSLLDYATSLDPIQAQMIAGKQCISETKYDTLVLPAAQLASSTQFFSAPSSDVAIKNFEGPGTLVLSGKLFLIQTIAVKLCSFAAALTGQNVIDFVNRTALRIQIDQKVMGTWALHQLTGAGGVFNASSVAVTAAAAPVGAIATSTLENGVPQNQPFRIKPLLVEGQKQFSAFLIGPTTTPITLAGTMEVKVLVGGLQYQAIQ